jgi:hypothetical protein
LVELNANLIGLPSGSQNAALIAKKAASNRPRKNSVDVSSCNGNESDGVGALDIRADSNRKNGGFSTLGNLNLDQKGSSKSGVLLKSSRS